jgi:acyl dehydratase
MTAVRNASLPVAPVSLAAGDTMPEFATPPLSRSHFVRYAGAGGDFNPIHHDEPMAISAGMPSVFGMGLLHAGIAGVRLARWVGPENIRSFAVRFTGQVWPGDVLSIAGVVDGVHGDIAEITLTVTRQTGDVALTARATATAAS